MVASHLLMSSAKIRAWCDKEELLLWKKSGSASSCNTRVEQDIGEIAVASDPISETFSQP